MNNKRNMIKWMPFNSVSNGKELITDILYEKSKIVKPILSEEQTMQIEKSIINAFYEHKKIKIDFYYNGNIYSCESNIKKIDFIHHKIYFNNKTLIFEQILNID